MSALFEVRGVSKSFDGVTVLEHVDLDIHAREFLTLIGLSGSGKSVLLKMLIGLIRPDAGTIRFDGERVDGLSEQAWFAIRKQVGISFQEPALFDSMSVEDNIAYGLREHGETEGPVMLQRIADSLTQVGLPGIEKVAPASLSGGMRKRVGIARAVAMRPCTLIYDEPTEGLDPINVTRVNNLMLGLRDALSITTIIATHNMKAAFDTSDRIAFLHQGRIACEGPPDALVQNHPKAMASFVEKAVFQIPVVTG